MITETAEKTSYTSRIIKASALIRDTKVLLSEWDLDQMVSDNLERAQRENIFGKASRSRVEDILLIFRQRYFDEPEVGEALVTLAQSQTGRQWLDPLLYFFTVQNDATLRDMVVEVISPRQQSGRSELPKEVVERAVRHWVAEGKTTTAWSDYTTGRVARGIMATLRDFGILEGQAHKRIAPVYLPTPAFVLIARWLEQRLRSGKLVLHSEEWRLFFLNTEGVERNFIEAHQEHLLHYYAAGSVVRIEFPEATLPDYARFLLDRYHS